MTDSKHVKRRDFLAGMSLAPLVTPWIARAAYAQDARATAPTDTALSPEITLTVTCWEAK